MYYLQLSMSVIFLIGFIVSLVYQFSLSVKVSTDRLNTRDAMRKSFSVSFYTWMSMFILVFIWTDKKSWSFEQGILAFILFFGVAIVFAGISALGLWRWKR